MLSGVATIGYIRRGASIVGPMDHNPFNSFHLTASTEIGQHRLHDARFWVEVAQGVVKLTIAILVDHDLAGKALRISISV